MGTTTHHLKYHDLDIYSLHCSVMFLVVSPIIILRGQQVSITGRHVQDSRKINHALAVNQQDTCMIKS